jgi:acetyltransferase-like isoleucine patch superfamily enzyme
MRISVVVVADTRASAVEASLQALVPAVAHAEATGSTVEIIVVDGSGRTDVAGLLRGVEGARVLRAPGTDRAGALAQGVAAASGDVVWFGGTESSPVTTAITTLADAVGREGGVAVAAPDDPAPHAAAPADMLRRLWKKPRGGTGVDPVPELVRRAGAAGVLISRCTGAGTLKARVRRPVGDDGRIVAGPATYSGPATIIKTYTDLDQVELGGYCSIADDVRIVHPGGQLFDEMGGELRLSIRGGHREESASTFPIGILVPDEPYDEPPPGATGQRMVIGDDVWVGFGATILGGVTVGTGSIIGARALVVADVPPYSVVGGVPARIIRRRFEDDVVDRLLRVAWWDWPQIVVEGAHRWFSRPVREFLDHFDPGSVGATPSAPDVA